MAPSPQEDSGQRMRRKDKSAEPAHGEHDPRAVACLAALRLRAFVLRGLRDSAGRGTKGATVIRGG